MIISFSQLGNHGRLGNQLFEVASTLGIAERHGAEALFPAWEYGKFFEVPGATFEIPGSTFQVPGKVVKERQFGFYDWDLNPSESADLLGYLQSEKYFGSARLKLRDEFVELVKANAGTLFDKPVICMQIRRGDYVGNGNYYQLSANWYIDALLTNFPDWREHNILFVSDDIEYCRTHFECMPNSYFSTGKSDIEDMALASCCDHFIISNSSFGWWCAWLGEQRAMQNAEGGMMKIVHCGCLHSGKLTSKGHADYYPERWIEHKRESYKIPLTDVTFTIPVFMDHVDRKANLDLSLYMLQAAFDSNYIICEQGGNKFEYTSKWAKYMRSDAKVFHRTKMLNDMCNASETEIIVNWDCDVIIPPMQILMAVEELRTGADVVYPYDGKFARMPREPWFGKIQKHRDIGIVGAERFKGREEGHNSVGGAVMFNKQAFMDGGMENEAFISFGPEDCERHDRFKLLGFDIRRVKGALFHLNHFVGVNSSPRNPKFRGNHKELEKIRAMSAEELRAYVDTWKWRNPYTSRYYHRISEGAMRSAKIVMEALGVGREASVIDVGCGVGEWSCENPNYVGVDYRVRPKELLIPIENYIECDLEREFVALDRKFDLCLCLEVAEHLRPHRAEGLVKMLCGLSDRVLFSAAIPFQGGVGHVNEQWQSWWAELFWKNGFAPALDLADIRRNQEVELWYRNNIVLYKRGGLGKVEDRVMPEFYMQIVGHMRNVQQSAVSDQQSGKGGE
jgi:hypothetical protein